MAELPRVAILIPCRNAGAWLRAAVDSALRQEGVRPQVIVCDDGSTDDSLATLADLPAGAVTVLRQSSRGGNAARNALLAATDCAWAQFLDADDYLEPRKVATQLAEGDSLEADVLYSPVWSEWWKPAAPPKRDLPALDTSADLFTQWITWQLPQTGGALWRTDALRRIGGWNERMPCCQEHELYLRALQAGLRWQFCPTPGAVYRLWSEDTVCRKDPLRVIRVRTELIDAMLAWLAQTNRLEPVHRAAAQQAFFEMARTWARHDLDGATEYFQQRRAGPGVRVHGPAAPLAYRVINGLFGFARAETLARRLR